MERNHPFELGLFPSNAALSFDIHDQNFSREDQWTVNQQEITIFYNGRVCSFDFTELQARAIILLASRGTWGGYGDKTRRCGSASRGFRSNSPPPVLSVKKSLERFLQERRKRVKSTSSPRKRK